MNLCCISLKLNISTVCSKFTLTYSFGCCIIFLSLWIELLDAWRTSVVVVNGTHFVWSRNKTRKTILKYLKVGWSTKLKQGFTICKNTIHFQLRPFMHLAGNEFFNIIWIRTSNITKRENFVAIKLSKTTHLERNLYYLQQIN